MVISETNFSHKFSAFLPSFNLARPGEETGEHKGVRKSLFKQDLTESGSRGDYATCEVKTRQKCGKIVREIYFRDYHL